MLLKSMNMFPGKKTHKNKTLEQFARPEKRASCFTVNWQGATFAASQKLLQE